MGRIFGTAELLGRISGVRQEKAGLSGISGKACRITGRISGIWQEKTDPAQLYLRCFFLFEMLVRENFIALHLNL